MSRWKELPARIDGSERQLLAQLRRLKDHSGLSLAALAGRTSYSRSSWERYLNGKKPVPRQAVEELAQVCGTEPTRLIVLYEVAERARAKAPAQPDEPSSPSESAQSASPPQGQDQEQTQEQAQASRRPVRTVPLGRMLVAVTLAVAMAFGAGLLTARAWDEDAPAEETGAVAAGTGYLRGQTYECDVQRKDGELRAGHSDTREMLLDINSTGFDVVEAQCLLREKGFDPSSFDGLYGERTKKAAKDFQHKHHLVVDGIIGPDTWRELRR
ncbi:helix-turn-helix domain-containing protein [Streptomyces sp. BE133]|uniref:helix-turn-helix domain-containing protein n=1 Tax=Streptomyces sp. BE133 TaxID=3002523 RepID=UPI002E78B42C|nr:helix-turn-helix domain-containing protein [Streptomyces sp. BE133]MEE1808442.1 helix-turn-helix domain-containing protein [Streptomyces sp. BE133]